MTSTDTTCSTRMVRTTTRLLSATLLSMVVLAVGAAWGCGGANTSGFPATGDDGGFGGDSGVAPIPGLTSIVVTPATTSLSLQYPVSAPGATTQLAAQGP